MRFHGIALQDARVNRSSSRYTKGFDQVCELLWAAGLIFLPISSFPLFSSYSGALVAPLSLLPFFILFLLITLPLVFHRGELPKETVPLIVFFLVVVISCAAAYFFFIPGFKGKSIPTQEIRALFTLAVGLCFYLVTTSWVKSIDRLQNSWKYITMGGILVVAWAGIQAFYIFQNADSYPSWMNQVQSWLSVRSPQYSPRYGRVNGLTYEASWFAHQMVMLYLPIWIAATYKKTSAFKIRLFHISAENVLLVAGVVVFFLSSPRIGLISVLLMLIYLFVRITLDIYRKIVAYLSKMQNRRSAGSIPVHSNWIKVLTGLSIIAVYTLVLAGIFYFAVQRDWRLAALVNNPPSTKELVGVLSLDQDTLLHLSQRFIFLERMVYWLNGWNVFNHYPWLGVGLGNAGFFFPKFAPAMGWATFEIRNVLFYLTQLPNVKSFWFRLLAETGIIGFSVFITWLYVLFQSTRLSLHNQNSTVRTFAFAGQLSLLAFIGEGFSIDSFAMPYLWVIAGLVAAIALISRRVPPNNFIEGD
jgi:hypothetical protein